MEEGYSFQAQLERGCDLVVLCHPEVNMDKERLFNLDDGHKANSAPYVNIHTHDYRLQMLLLTIAQSVKIQQGM